MLTLNFLGTPELIHNSTPLEIKSIKARALLFYLACEQRPHSRQSLAGLLWGDSPEETARNNLRNQLSKLRTTLGDYLIIDRRSIAFNAAQPHAIDVLAFEQTKPHLVEIAMSYRGDFLADFNVSRAPDFELWQLAQRERLRQKQLSILRLLADGATPDALTWAQRWVMLDPLEEAAHARTIALLMQQSRPAEAQRQLESCRRYLAEELGMDVSAETIALIQRKPPTKPQPQITASLLPAATTRFIGREAELSKLNSLIQQPDCRLLTIVGMGGIGKTHLSLALARHLEADGIFTDGAQFIELAGSDQLLLPLIEAFNIKIGGNQSPKQALINYVRTKNSLLVLDNFEHLVEQSELLVELLQAAPQLKILCSSRHTLGLYEEWVFELEGLGLAVDEGAVALFAHRAQRIFLNFELAPNLAAVQRICTLMDGMPLGIELAASWTRTLTCEQIATQLADNIDALKNEVRNLPPRHITMQAVFNHSWALLEVQEREQLAALSVFRGGFLLEAAQSVVGTQARDLSRLLNRSLLRRGADGRYLMHALVRQFSAEKYPIQPTQQRHSDYFAQWMASRFQTVRTKLEGESVAAVVADFANVRAGLQWAVTHPAGDVAGYVMMLQMTLLRRSWYHEGCAIFDMALGNLVPRLDPNQQQRALGLLRFSYAEFLYRSGQLQAAPAQFEMAAADLVAQRIWHEAALAYSEWANTLIVSGNIDAAEKAVALAHDAAYQSEDEAVIDPMTHLLRTAKARIAIHRAEWDVALAYYQQDLANAVQLEHQRNIAAARNNIATMELKRGNFAAALQAEQQALELARTLDEPLLIGIDTAGLGDIYLALGELDSAETNLSEAINIFREMGATRWLASSLTTMGAVYREQKRLPLADKTLTEALALAESNGARPGVLNGLLEFGRLQLAQQKPKQAAETFREILADPACSHALKATCEQMLMHSPS